MMEFNELLTTLSTPAVVCSASLLLFGGAALDRVGLWLAERRHAQRARESTLSRIRAGKAPPGVPAVTGGVPCQPPGVARNETRTVPGRSVVPTVVHVAAAPHGAGAPLAPVEPVFERSDTWAAAPEEARVPDAVAQMHTVTGALGRVQMAPQQQLAEYIAFVRRDELGLDTASGRYRCTRSGAGWVTAYRRWAAARDLVAIPELTLLRGLSDLATRADASGVSKSRDRLRDPMTGAVLRNAHGTPVRGNYYPVFEAPAVAARAAPAKAAKAAPRKSSAQLLEEIEVWSRQRHGQPPARRAA